MKLIILFVTIVIASISQPVCGQNVAVKTNLLSDAILSPNIGVEIGLAPKWTLDVSGQMNAWTLSHDRRWKHWAIQRATGCATDSVRTFLACICTAASTISAVSTAKSTSSARMRGS